MQAVPQKIVQSADVDALMRVDPEQACHLAELVHGGILAEFFPMDEERDDLSTWLRNLRGERPDGPVMLLTVVGTDLWTRDAEVGAFIASEYMPASNCGLITYLARRKDAPRGLGSGVALRRHHTERMQVVAERYGRSEVAGVFAEANDPRKVDADVMDPTLRLRAFTSRAAGGLPMQPMDLDYTQPPLRPGAEPCSELLLLSHPRACGTHLRDLGTLEGFLEEYWAGLDAAGHPALRRMLRQVAEMRAGRRPAYLDTRPARQRASA